MPAEQTTILDITCDNPDCPGNDLDKTDRTGWLFISSEVYGQPTQQHVFCSQECVNAATAGAPELFAGPKDAPAQGEG